MLRHRFVNPVMIAADHYTRAIVPLLSFCLPYSPGWAAAPAGAREGSPHFSLDHPEFGHWRGRQGKM